MCIQSRPCLKLSLLFALAVWVSGCGGEGEGGGATVIVPINHELVRQPQTFIVENLEGGEGLQEALDAARAGDTILIRAGENVFNSDYLFPGELVRGFTLSTSGTADAPIRIVGEASSNGDLPVIDQRKSSVHDDSSAYPEPTVGLLLLCASYVEVSNLEIRNAHLAGVTSSLGACESEGVRIENNHIHHVYGDFDVGAIRLSRVSDVLISGKMCTSSRVIALYS